MESPWQVRTREDALLLRWAAPLHLTFGGEGLPPEPAPYNLPSPRVSLSSQHALTGHKQEPAVVLGADSNGFELGALAAASSASNACPPSAPHLPGVLLLILEGRLLRSPPELARLRLPLKLQPRDSNHEKSLPAGCLPPALDCSSSRKHQGLFVLAAAAADARRTGRGHAIVAEGPPRPGLCPGLVGGAHALSSSVRIGPFQSSPPTLGVSTQQMEKWPGHRPKGDVAVRRGSLQQPQGQCPGRAVHTGCALRAHRQICSSARSTPVVFWALLSRWLTTDLEKTGLPGSCHIWAGAARGRGRGQGERPGETA